MIVADMVLRAIARGKQRGMTAVRLYLSHDLWDLTLKEASAMTTFASDSCRRQLCGLPVTLLDAGNPRVVCDCGEAFELGIIKRSQV